MDPNLLSPRPAIYVGIMSLDTSCNDLTNCRSVWDILYGCAATIFACVWVTVHPNVPGYNDTQLRILADGVALMIVALIAPELVVHWALRQYLAARDFKQKHDVSITHAFFLGMGGFVVPEGDGHRPVTQSMIGEEVRLLELTRIDRRDIEDKSKDDFRSKCIAFAQIIWFVCQSIGRPIQELPLLEVELVTLAFAMLSLVSFFLWWNKPLRVERPVVLSIESALPSSSSRSLRSSSVGSGQAEWLIRLVSADQMVMQGHSKVPLLWTGELSDAKSSVALLVAFLLGIAFGGVHLLAWQLEFPDEGVKMVWIVSSIILIAAPTVGLLVTIAEIYVKDGVGFLASVSYCSRMLFIVLIPYYVVARLCLLVLPLVCLLNPPEKAYWAVSWSAFFPHV